MLVVHVLLNHVKKLYHFSCTHSLTIGLPKYCQTFVEIKMGRLSLANRNRAIGLLQAGTAKRHVARILNCSRVTIQKYWRRVQQGQSLDDLPRSGRPHVTTPNQDRYICLTHARRRFTPATETARNTVGTHNRRISAKTVRRRLATNQMFARRPYKGPILTRRHRRNRLAWANNHVGWTRQQWREVLFTDESKFNLSFADGNKRIYRRRGERFAQCCVLEHNRWVGGGIMVWAGISADQKTALHVVRGRLNAIAYRDTIVQHNVLPFMAQHRLRLFQQDNARPHVARVTLDFLRQQHVNTLPWPSLSPDLSPIEHVWAELGRQVRSRPVQPANLQQLEAALNQEWQAIPQYIIRRYVQSMHRRCQAVIQAQGGHTRY